MKIFLLVFVFANLTFAEVANAQAAATCSLKKEEIDALNLYTGAKRLEILSNAATILENPDLAKAIGDPANTQSAAMYSLTETLGAATLAANETINTEKSGVLNKRCTSIESFENEKVNGTFQLFSNACTISELVNRITNLMAESDLLEQQAIEAKAAINQAAAENLKRDAEIKKQKDQMESLNKEIKAALKELDTAKKAHTKAEMDVMKAQLALAQANAIPCVKICSEDDNCTEDCSARDAAVAAATKVLDAANKALAKAAKALEKAVNKTVDLLVNKFGVETQTVLALLSGTIRGETDGGDVHFKVADSDFTLIDLGQAIKDAGGDGKKGVEKVQQFIGGDDLQKTTESYFSTMIGAYERSERAGHVEKPSSGIEGSMYLSMMGPSGAAAQKEVLGVFASLENGADYLETFALAVQDYGNAVGKKQVSTLEAMKTPQSRLDEMQRQNELKRKQIEDLKIMINKNICYLDKMLVMFKDFYKAASETIQKKDPFFAFINSFKTDKLKQKEKEGYFSKVNFKGIQQEFECYTKGGDANSCKNLSGDLAAEGSNGGTCHWSGAVIGPSAPVKDICDKSKIGLVTYNDSGNQLVCKCL